MKHPRLKLRTAISTGALALGVAVGAAGVALVGGGTHPAGASNPIYVTAGPCDGIGGPSYTCSGSNAGGALGIVPGNTGTIALGEGLFSVSYTCPAVLTTTAMGYLKFNNTTSDVMNVFSSRRTYVRLAAGTSSTIRPKVKGDVIDWQIQHPTLGLATIHVAVANRLASNDCHLQVQTVITRP
jgi:hypothetical protein